LADQDYFIISYKYFISSVSAGRPSTIKRIVPAVLDFNVITIFHKMAKLNIHQFNNVLTAIGSSFTPGPMVEEIVIERK
jgi:hypothetical protein